MDVLIGGLVTVTAIVVLAFVLARKDYRPRKAIAKEKWMHFYNVDKRSQAALDSESVDRVKEAISNLEAAHAQDASALDETSEQIYATDRDDLYSHLHGLEEERWLRQAMPYLRRFSDCWLALSVDPQNPFRDAEYLLGLARKCVDAWQSYFAVDLEQFSVTIYPKRYLREYMGESYDPCMESSDALRKKLAGRVDTLRPEAIRKRKLDSLIVNFVEQKSSVQRSHLLKTPFEGFTPEEIGACYRGLVAKNRLVAVKIGDRYFVSLSDKEAERRAKQRDKKTSRE